MGKGGIDLLLRMEKSIHIFYLFFQGILVFQTIFLLVLYYLTRRKDVFYYAIYLLLSAAYFFLNAPNTFFGLHDDAVFNSAVYNYGNIPLIIVMHLFYILFVRSFFSGLYESDRLHQSFRLVLLTMTGLLAAFLVLRFVGWGTQPVFYMANFLGTILGAVVLADIYRKRIPDVGWVAAGIIMNMIGNGITMIMVIMMNNGVEHLMVSVYPLIFMRIGLLADMFFYQVAILKKWQHQEKELATERIEKQLAVERVRNQISSQLHDDIGSTLSGVSMYSHLASDQLKQGAHQQAYATLHTIQQSAREVVDKLGDLVWSVHAGYDSLGQVLDKIQQYAQDMCMTKQMAFVSRVQVDVNIHLTEEQRYHLFLCLKEAVNNSVKYSAANRLLLKADKVIRTFIFFVEENGV